MRQKPISRLTGTVLWRARVRAVYASLAELRGYNEVYHVVDRCGYRSAAELWEANPMLQGSTNPIDFGIHQASKVKRK